MIPCHLLELRAGSERFPLFRFHTLHLQTARGVGYKTSEWPPQDKTRAIKVVWPFYSYSKWEWGLPVIGAAPIPELARTSGLRPQLWLLVVRHKKCRRQRMCFRLPDCLQMTEVLAPTNLAQICIYSYPGLSAVLCSMEPLLLRTRSTMSDVAIMIYTGFILS